MQALAQKFVAVADEVGRLQRGEDAECRFFQSFAEKGHYAGRQKPSATRQGIYAITAAGDLLASINTRDAAQVAAMLETALTRFAALPRAQRSGDAPALTPSAGRFEAFYPRDGLVLQVFTRDLPRAATVSDWRALAWNTDHLWFRRDEMLQLLPGAEVGAEALVPAPLLQRLVVCHLIDNVRGQTPAHRPQDIVHVQLTARTEAVDGDVQELRFFGSARVERSGQWGIRGFDAAVDGQTLGYDATFSGEASFDRAAGRFMRFRLLAAGDRWGGTAFNGRHDDLAPAPMGVAFTLADPDDRTAPSLHWTYGWR